MNELLAVLESRVAGRGVASVAYSSRRGAARAWTPEQEEEPAFLAYSITKIFTAVLALQLRDWGLVSLGDALARWFPAVPSAGAITIRQLLNHTSGIPDYGPLPHYHEAVRTSPSEPWDFARYGAETWEKGLLFSPGTAWSYSNPGYMLLKAIAERVTGKSYGALVDEMIARPLRLRRTVVAETVADVAQLASPPPGYHPGWVSHGVVASTPSEIVTFVEAVFGGSLISDDSLREMLEMVPIGPGEHHAYGLGLMGDVDPHRPVGHNGGGPGYATSVFNDRERRATACVMAAVEEGFDAEGLVHETLALA